MPLRNDGPGRSGTARYLSYIYIQLTRLYKSLSSGSGRGGDLTVPMIGPDAKGARKRAALLADLAAPYPNRQMKPFLVQNKSSIAVAPFPRGILTTPPKIRKSWGIKKRITFNTLPINLEILEGDVKSGIGPDKKKWSHKYKVPYGEIDKTFALSDGDPVDVYLGGNEKSDKVFIVHQVKLDGKFDEDKVMLGFNSAPEAIKCYFDHGPEWGFGSLDAMSFENFKNGYLAANRESMRKSRLLSPPCHVEYDAQIKPENAIEADIASHKGHYDRQWSNKFKKTFNVDKFDDGGISDSDIGKFYEGLKEANIPGKLWKNYPAKKEVHIEKPTKVMPTIKGYFQEHRHSPDGRVYIFHKAFEYMDKPYRIPGTLGLYEISVHEIGHFIFSWPLKKLKSRYDSISGWTLFNGAVPDGYVQSDQNPKWLRLKSTKFVDDYAAKAPNEDEAETFAWYIFRPDKLKSKCPEKFKFFMRYVGPIKNKWWEKYA